MNAPSTFSAKISVGGEAIYIDSKEMEGIDHSFSSMDDLVTAIRDMGRIAQVIVPKESFLAGINGFQTELKTRSNKLSEHEKLARRVARYRAELPWDASRRDEFRNEAERKRFREELAKARLMSDSALKKALEEAKTADEPVHDPSEQVLATLSKVATPQPVTA